jgi:hypothetical protein
MKDRLANFFNPSFRMNHFYRKNLTLPASSIVFDLGELNSQRMYLDISVESQRALLAYIGMINPNLKISIAEYFGEIAYHDLPQERTSSFDLRRNGIHALIFSIILWLIILEFGAILSIN